MSHSGKRRPPVTVAVVSWNTRELLVRCLESLAPEVRAGRAEVAVVDNGSSDGSADAVRRRFAWATLIEPGRNVGFGRAVNIVARRTAGEWLACANADVALTDGALERMLGAGADPRVGCVAPRLLLPDGTTQHSVFPFPSIAFALGFQLGLHRLRPARGDRLCLEGFWNPEVRRTVPWAIGAFLLLRRRAFAAAGGFDERQWLYAEDLDLGWRLRDAGWVTLYEPSAVVLHESGASTAIVYGESRTAAWQRQTYAVIRRRRGRAYAWILAAVNMLGSAVRIAALAPAAALATRFREPLAMQRAWLRAHASALRGLL